MKTACLSFPPLFTVPCGLSDVLPYERIIRTDGSTKSPPEKGFSSQSYAVIETLIFRYCRVIFIRQDEGKIRR